MRPAITNLHDKVQESLATTGYQELALAMKGGLLSIDPLSDIDIRLVGDRSDDDIAGRYFTRVQDTLTAGYTYPLFDPATSNW